MCVHMRILDETKKGVHNRSKNKLNMFYKYLNWIILLSTNMDFLEPHVMQEAFKPYITVLNMYKSKSKNRNHFLAIPTQHV